MSPYAPIRLVFLVPPHICTPHKKEKRERETEEKKRGQGLHACHLWLTHPLLSAGVGAFF